MLHRRKFSRFTLSFLASITLGLGACSVDTTSKTPHAAAAATGSASTLVYLDETRLQLTQAELNNNNPVFVKAYKQVLKSANQELKKAIDPVTNKTVLPASGDIHDYHTLGSYYWPDDTKANGLPWVYKDGEFNPINRGPATDWERRKKMLSALGTLNMAYYFSHDEKYIQKAKQIVQVWFINKDTKMNPNIDYGKAIPGKSSGTNFAVIDWTDIGKVVTTVQLLERHNLWSAEDKTAMDQWFNDYYRWLTTSEFGILEDTRKNNHGTNYDYQAIGLMIYLGKIDAAEAKIEAAKASRIAAQIDADGSQPLELARTKSVNYSVNNLWALARIADLSQRHTRIDLWSYENDNGVSLKKGYDFMVPYIAGEKDWQWKQIIGGGAKPQLKNLALPMFSRSELLLGKTILPKGLNGYAGFKPREILEYAPVAMSAATPNKPTYDPHDTDH